jgi:hypothetical protein
MAAVARGETVGPGIPIRRRLEDRGQDPQEWWERLR